MANKNNEFCCMCGSKKDEALVYGARNKKIA